MISRAQLTTKGILLQRGDQCAVFTKTDRGDWVSDVAPSACDAVSEGSALELSVVHNISTPQKVLVNTTALEQSSAVHELASGVRDRLVPAELIKWQDAKGRDWEASLTLPKAELTISPALS